MWLLLFASQSKRQLFSLILSHFVNIALSILFIVFGVKGLLEGEQVASGIFLAIGLLIAGLTIFLIQKSIRRMIKEKSG